MLDPRHSGRPLDSSMVYSHSRTRTTSSNIFPIQAPTPMHGGGPMPGGMPGSMPMNMQMQMQMQQQQSRRSPSVNTFSTSGSTVAPPAAYRTSPTTDLRRSTSSRSGGHGGHGGSGGGAASPQPTSYVALLRKQKATVWCDRAQYEDPGMAARQRAAKMKATLEVIGGGGPGQRVNSGLGLATAGGRTSTGISATGKVAAKIRHHGKTAVVGYAPGENHVGVGGVPMRLSATEVEGESSDDDDSGVPPGMSRLHHRRTGSSGRSSTTSRRGIPYRASGQLGSQSGRRWSPGDTPERSGSLVEEAAALERQVQGLGITDDAASGKARSTGSGSSAERADNVTELGSPTGAPRLAANSLINSTLVREKSTKSVEDLRRRGSVDERTMTMSAGRLYIANPD